MSVRSAGSSAPAAGGGQGDLSRMRWRARLEEPAVAVVALLLAWIALVAVANPTGSFPLNDDWSYSRAVKNLVEHGELEFTGWTSMTLSSR